MKPNRARSRYPRTGRNTLPSRWCVPAPLGRAVVTQVRSWAINSPLERIRLRADCERLTTLVAQQQEELGLLRMRFERVPSKSRPHFTPPERLRVLQLKAASGWSAAETARRLLLAPISTLSEVLACPHFVARGYWCAIEHPELGRSFLYPGPFARFGSTPVVYRARPPAIGEHNAEVLGRELGLSAAELADRQREGVT